MLKTLTLLAGLCLLTTALWAAPAGTTAGNHTAAPPTVGNPTQGQRVYQNTCAFCHGTDPAKGGTVGPPIQGSSRELIRARVTQAAYPPGYLPKRTTHNMPPFPALASEVDNLAAFLR